MLKLSKNIQKSKLLDLTRVFGEGLCRGYQNSEILKFGQCLHVDEITSPSKFGEVT